MSVLPLAKIGKLLNKPRLWWKEKQNTSFLTHIQYLMDTKVACGFSRLDLFEGNHNFAAALMGAR